ncbi:DUF177 domain-containing protein [bacterium]|nr:DUF177 domain-containing protein [bacterium]PIV81104.1 MAG: hypothetical protein COW53_06160 [bacterium CG17_big_fil_post_rev_8_21_14_2_50_64_8]PJA75615.1 MAG: hypothetical protein CO151_05345 [bacterium CG_4_9_14_3_um_filter_65_15]
MKLDLDRIPHGRSELELSGVLALEWGADRPAAAFVEGTLVVDNLEGRVLAEGEVHAHGEAVCTRCLGNFDLAWPVKVSCMVLRDTASDEGRDDSMVISQRGGEVDLREVLRESAILAFPLTVSCGPECRGLCAGCGRNLNEEACVCEAENHDPRWDALP